MDTLPIELKRKTALNLNYYNLNKLRLVSKDFNNIYNDYDFWLEKVQQKVGKIDKTEYDNIRKIKLVYLEIETNNYLEIIRAMRNIFMINGEVYPVFKDTENLFYIERLEEDLKSLAFYQPEIINLLKINNLEELIKSINNGTILTFYEQLYNFLQSKLNNEFYTDTIIMDSEYNNTLAIFRNPITIGLFLDELNEFSPKGEEFNFVISSLKPTKLKLIIEYYDEDEIQKINDEEERRREEHEAYLWSL